MGLLRNVYRSVRSRTPWLSLAAPFVFVGLMAFLKSLSPDLFCVAITSGGKELICGGDYTHIGIRWLQLFGHTAWVMLLVIGGAEVFQRRASWLAAIAWSISALLFVGLVLLLLNLPVDDCP